MMHRHAEWLHRWNVLDLYKMVNLVCVQKIRIVNQPCGVTSPPLCWAWLTDAGAGVEAGGELISPYCTSLSNALPPITCGYSICYPSRAE